MADNGPGAQRRGCFKYGCFGCLGAIGLFILVVGGIAVMALVLGPPEQEFVQPEVTRRLPGGALPVALTPVRAESSLRRRRRRRAV